MLELEFGIEREVSNNFLYLFLRILRTYRATSMKRIFLVVPLVYRLFFSRSLILK